MDGFNFNRFRSRFTFKRTTFRLSFKTIAIGVAAVGIVLVVSLALKSKQSPPKEVYVNPYETLVGVALSPKNYEGEDFNSFFTKAKELGNTVSWAGPWQEFSKTDNAAEALMTRAKQNDFMPVIITGPTIEEVQKGGYQTEMAEAIGKFVTVEQPKYLGIGNGIDEFFLDSPELLTTYIESIKETLTRVRSVSSSIKVFATLQYERSSGLNGGLFGGENDESKNILKDILPQLEPFDFIAFTTYPGLIYKTPSELPNDYYTKIKSLTTKPVIFTEIGWSRSVPAEGYDGSESAQAEFIKKFRDQMKDVQPTMQLWSFLYPQKVKSPFDTMSLLADDQETSPSFEAWKTK